MELFDQVYQTARWGTEGNRSGPGSSLEYTDSIVQPLKDFINERQIKTIVDTSCGGMFWWPRIIDNQTRFYGYDVSPMIIRENQERFKSQYPNWTFEVGDATDPKILYPSCDLIMTRHTMMHLSLTNAVQLMNNLLKTPTRFIMATSHSINANPTENEGIPLLSNMKSGFRFRYMNLEISPFYLGSPIYQIRESRTETLEFLNVWQPRNVIIISGIFGSRFRKCYPAPLPGQSYFFTNDPSLEHEISAKGWIPIWVNFPLTTAEDISSRQSKYVKFLQFLKDYSLWSNRIVYIDHKFFLTPSHIEKLLAIHNPGIIIRETPMLKISVWDEYQAMQGQERYRKYNSETRTWIQQKLTEGYTENNRVCNTGLICYSCNQPRIFPLISEVYSAVLETGNPECQVFWTLLSQRYSDIIKMIPWNQIPILWQEP